MHKIGKSTHVQSMTRWNQLELSGFCELSSALFRIEIAKLKIKSDLLTLKNTHHKGERTATVKKDGMHRDAFFPLGNLRFVEETPPNETSQCEHI